MELLPDEIKARLPKLYSQEHLGEDALVAVKFFSPVGAGTWLATEGEFSEDHGTWLFFGWVTIFGDGWECGNWTLAELEEVRLPFGLRIERDLYLEETTVREVIRR